MNNNLCPHELPWNVCMAQECVDSSLKSHTPPMVGPNGDVLDCDGLPWNGEDILPDWIMGGSVTHYTDRVGELVVLIEEYLHYGEVILAWDDKGEVGLTMATLLYNQFKDQA